MRFLPNVLLVLSLPAGFIGYGVGVQMISGLPLPKEIQDILIVFGPLFIAALFMVPFLIPFFDRKAKQDLAAYRLSQAASAKSGAEGAGKAAKPAKKTGRAS